MPAPRVDILLATYNGARFLETQVESILDQLGPECRLLVRDDGSTDGTRALLDRYAAGAGRIVLLQDELGQLGACGCFARLLEAADADYVVFSDQDDVWLPSRIAAPLAHIQAVERQHGVDRPILVHTDLTVVDERLHVLAPSFWTYGRIEPVRAEAFNRLLVQNVVTGCATTVNRALARLAAPIPPGALMHDWWLALVAAALGRIEQLDEPTVLYRQHASNCVGATRWNWSYVLRSALTMLNRRSTAKRLDDTQRQAAALLERFASRLPPEQQAAVRAYVSLGSSNFLQRRKQIVRYGFCRTGWIRNLGWFAGI